MPQQAPEIDSPQPLKNRMRALHDALQEFLESHEKYTTDKGMQEIDGLLKSFSASIDQFTFLTTDPKSGLVKTDESIAGMTDTFEHMHAALKKLESYSDLNEGLKEELKQLTGDLKEMLKHQNIFMHAQNPMNTPRERLDEETRELFNSVDQMYVNMNKLYQQSAKLSGLDIAEDAPERQANAASANAANNNATDTEAAAGLARTLPADITRNVTNIAEETEKHIQRVMVNTLVNAGLSPERAQAEYNSLKDNFSGLSAAVGEGAARAASGQILAQNQAVQQQNQLKDHQETLDKKNGIDKNEGKHASLANTLGGTLAEVAGIGAKLNGLAITAGLSSLGYEQSAQLSANAPSGKPNIPSQEAPMIPPR